MAEYLPLFATISVAHLLAAMSPGPDFVLCVRNSLAHGRAAGTWTGVGFALGVAAHCTFAALGLAVLVERSLLLFTAIKLLGAAYLLWIGSRALLSRSSGAAPDISAASVSSSLPAHRAMMSGLLTNLLNPKVILFFLGLFTMVVAPGTPAWVLAAAGLLMVAQTALWFAVVSFCFARPAVRAGFYRWENFINRAFGAVLVAFGIKLATMTHE